MTDEDLIVLGKLMLRIVETDDEGYMDIRGAVSGERWVLLDGTWRVTTEEARVIGALYGQDLVDNAK